VNFNAADRINALDGLMLPRNAVVEQIVSYCYQIFPVSVKQYNGLAELAVVRRGCVIEDNNEALFAAPSRPKDDPDCL
jgi:hypothetical protein